MNGTIDIVSMGLVCIVVCGAFAERSEGTTSQALANTFYLKQVNAQRARPLVKISALPADVDWRKDTLSAPKNQGDCDCSAPFAYVAALEALIKIHHVFTVDLSEQHIAACMGNSCTTATTARLLENAINHGQTKGVSLEECAPYTMSSANPGVCNGMDTVRCPEWKKHLWRHTAHYPIGNDLYEYLLEDSLRVTTREWIMLHIYNAPVLSNIRECTELKGYKGGIIKTVTSPSAKKHAVCVVGYSTSDPNNRYWIVRNSRGTAWGEGGYFRIAFDISDIEKESWAIDMPEELDASNPAGLEDMVQIIGGVSVLEASGAAPFTCRFYDNPPGGATVQHFSWKLCVFHKDGPVVVASETVAATSTTSVWTPPSFHFPANFAWIPNERGNIPGEISVYVNDSEGYDHSDYKTVEVKYSTSVRDRPQNAGRTGTFVRYCATRHVLALQCGNGMGGAAMLRLHDAFGRTVYAAEVRLTPGQERYIALDDSPVRSGCYYAVLGHGAAAVAQKLFIAQ